MSKENTTLSGFMENALKYAKSNGIICFEKNQNGEFIQSQYWT